MEVGEITTVGPVIFPGCQLYVTEPVPPEVNALMYELFPMQIVEPPLFCMVNAGGAIIVTVSVAVQPFPSVMVQVYVPAESPVAVEPVPPAGAQL